MLQIVNKYKHEKPEGLWAACLLHNQHVVLRQLMYLSDVQYSVKIMNWGKEKHDPLLKLSKSEM